MSETKAPEKPVHQPGVRRGEEIRQEDGKEPGRQDTGVSETGRPHGTSTARDATAINPDEVDPTDPQSPYLPPSN